MWILLLRSVNWTKKWVDYLDQIPFLTEFLFKLTNFGWGFLRSKICALNRDQLYQSDLQLCLYNFKFNPKFDRNEFDPSKHEEHENVSIECSNLGPPLRCAKISCSSKKQIFMKSIERVISLCSHWPHRSQVTSI